MSGNMSRMIDMGITQDVLLENLKTRNLHGKTTIQLNLKKLELAGLGFVSYATFKKSVQWRAHVGQ